MVEKYPRTYHLPFSPGVSSDDKKMKSVTSLLDRRLVISEKLDGSNMCIGNDYIFARSHSCSPTHKSFSFIKQWHAGMRHRIPVGFSVYFEYCYAVHSIVYEKMHTPMHVFAVKDEMNGVWLSWPDTVNFAKMLGMLMVFVNGFPVAETEKDLRLLVDSAFKAQSKYGDIKEGVVVRPFESFDDSDFSTLVGKYVRENHVQTNEHWSHKEVVKHPSLFGG